MASQLPHPANCLCFCCYAAICGILPQPSVSSAHEADPGNHDTAYLGEASTGGMPDAMSGVVPTSRPDPEGSSLPPVLPKQIFHHPDGPPANCYRDDLEATIANDDSDNEKANEFSRSVDSRLSPLVPERLSEPTYRPLERCWVRQFVNWVLPVWNGPFLDEDLMLKEYPLNKSDITWTPMQELCFHMNGMRSQLCPRYVQDVFIPLRRRYLRFVCRQLHRRLIHILTRHWDYSSAQEYCRSFIGIWTKYCYKLELRYVNLWDDLQQLLGEIAQEIITDLLDSMTNVGEVFYVLESMVVNEVQGETGLYHDYMFSDSGVLRIKTEMQDELELLHQVVEMYEPELMDLLYEPFRYQPIWEIDTESKRPQPLTNLPRLPKLPRAQFDHLLLDPSTFDFNEMERALDEDESEDGDKEE